MKRYIDLSEIPTRMLLEIRSVLEAGACASSDAKSMARRLKTENEALRKEKKYREIVASYDLDFDDDPDYFLAFSEAHLNTTCKLLSNAKRDVALAERTHTIKIPPVFRAEDVSGVELVRQGFKDRKNGHREVDM